jgi:hypothetical protein
MDEYAAQRYTDAECEAVFADLFPAEPEHALDELRESLETAHIEAVTAARQQPPPPTVQAYQSVYGHVPVGWPPTIGST